MSFSLSHEILKLQILSVLQYILLNLIKIAAAVNDEIYKGLRSIRAIFGLNILETLIKFVYLVLYLHYLNVITCF